MEVNNAAALLLLFELEEEMELCAAVLGAMENEDDLNERKREYQRVDINFWRCLGDPTFKDHFRMTRPVFQNLLVAVGRHLRDSNRIHFLRTPLDVALMMTVWVLATPDPFRCVATTFGVSKGVVYFHYAYLIQALREMANIYVRWPGPTERDIIKYRFERRYSYPGVVGCIDCCQIAIPAPTIQPQNYVNRHHDHALIIQAVCDDTLLYRDVYVGEAGAVGDARTFERSPLSNHLFMQEGYLDNDEHILGDGAYPLSRQILVPYANDGHLTRRQRVHNYQLSRCRATVERSFARLKGLMRRLKHLSSTKLEYAVNHIMSSLVLHNFIILGGERPGLFGDDFEPQHILHNPGDIRNVLQRGRGAGIAKRHVIGAMLCPRNE